MSEIVTKHKAAREYEGALDLCWYPDIPADAEHTDAVWSDDKPRRFGHCSGGPGDVHHLGQNCPVAMWSYTRTRWDICACECHHDLRTDEEALRELIAKRRNQKMTMRESIMAKKASTTVSKKASTTKAKIGRTTPDATAEVVNSKAPSRKPADCQCKCGGQTKGGRFLPGHDAKLKSALQSAYKAATTDAQRRKIEDEFTSLKWGKYIPAI